MDSISDLHSEDEPSSVGAKIASCQVKIGYSFRNIDYLQAALTHASGAVSRLHSNERMEFLGDSILGLVICEHLYLSYPEYLEGDLTKIKSVVVSRRVCAKIARQLGLEDCLIVGRGMMGNGGVPRSLLSDVFEAILAAVYLDGGFEAAKELVIRFVDPEIHLAIEGHTGSNYKSALQQYAQKELGGAPTYALVSERGPDHCKSFQVAAKIGEKLYSPAWGRSKKDAEQRAAGNALAELHGDEPPYTSL